MSKGLKKALAVIGIIVIILLLLALAAYLALSHDYSGAPPVSVAGCTNPHISKEGAARVSAHRSAAASPRRTRSWPSKTAWSRILRSTSSSSTYI